MTLLAPVRRRRSVQSSDLSRHAKDVFAAAEQEPLEVTRRDGAPLVLTTKERSDDDEAVLDIAAQLIAAVTVNESLPLHDRLAIPYPWLKLLSRADQQRFATEIVEVARGSFSLRQPRRLLLEMQAWRNSAEAIAAGWDTSEPDLLDPPVIAEKP
ncbi:prevent-host-death protein [Curtobacterium sp. VKM Ac-2865]|uniref:prevent-host-death protein n=1 Tax=Curtobacterium sp. VKM Ac-2865 TaxID=2783817 RepID=UPI00188B89E2|nr:prevent-host-death protein [Curtobacterium sp. VKM Ac-2865]MBF4582194.1 prevent-host-death protein [Curtobacterium sp. VKM Ac-2865]